MARSKVLIFDIECAGVQGLKADRSVVTHFGYSWLGSGRTDVMSLTDFNGTFRADGLDDTPLLKAASSVLAESIGLVAHFGEYFDKPFLDSRFLRAKLPIIPPVRLTDTCLIARKRLCLSSNRLANLAEFLGVKTKKMEKGRGWPDWWMGMLYGHKPSYEKVRTYCSFDVMCLEEVYLRMRCLIPMRQLPENLAHDSIIWTCPNCGGHKRWSRGQHWVGGKLVDKVQCRSCFAWPAQKALTKK